MGMAAAMPKSLARPASLRRSESMTSRFLVTRSGASSAASFIPADSASPQHESMNRPTSMSRSGIDVQRRVPAERGEHLAPVPLIPVGFADPDIPRPDDGVEAVIDKAYVRAWKAVDLLSLVHGADVDGRIDRDRTPHGIAIRLPGVGRSLSRQQETLGSFPGYRLVLFGDPSFAVNDAWFVVMLDGYDRISKHV